MTISSGRRNPVTSTSCQAIWKAIAETVAASPDNIYLGKYAGWYAVQDEAFYTEGELEEGPGGKKIAPSGAEVEWSKSQAISSALGLARCSLKVLCR